MAEVSTECAGTGGNPAASRFGWRVRVALSLIWLAYLAYPVANLLSTHPSPVRLGLDAAALLGFAVTYVIGMLRPVLPLDGTPGAWAMRPASWTGWVAVRVGLLTGLAVVLTLANGSAWVGLFLYPIGLTGASSGGRAGMLRILGLAGLATGCAVVTAGVGPSGLLGFELTMLAVGVSTLGFRRLAVTNAELHHTRVELARRAVLDERLRFSRDLHDLLGHSLTLVALKLQVARHLVEVDPSRVAGELDDIERVVRRALTEVRQAVGGYRRVTLADELAGARLALVSAGVELDERTALEGEPLSETVEAALAWAVREGTTNLLRHARARTCRIDAGLDSRSIFLELRDDGVGGRETIGPSAADAAGGQGLAGLRERIQQAGGRLVAGPAAAGGFHLRVEFPLSGATS